MHHLDAEATGKAGADCGVLKLGAAGVAVAFEIEDDIFGQELTGRSRRPVGVSNGHRIALAQVFDERELRFQRPDRRQVEVALGLNGFIFQVLAQAEAIGQIERGGSRKFCSLSHFS